MDKCLSETILSLLKGEGTLFLHGTIESATPEVHEAFKQGLNDALCMQSEMYQAMAQKGWYPATQAEQHCIQQAKEKFGQQQS